MSAGLLDWLATNGAAGGVLLALALLGDTFLWRRASARIRGTVLGIALARLVVPTGLSLPWGDALPSVVPPLARHGAADASAAVGAATLAPVVWALGATLVAAWLLVRERRVRRAMLAGTAPADAALVAETARAARRVGLRRTPVVRAAADRRPTAVVGTLRPVIVVGIHALPPADREHVLLHECAHLARHDTWKRAVALAVAACWWFHPLAWLAVARLAALRELACDATAARALGDGAGAYRATLVRAARRLLDDAPAGALAFAHAGGLSERLRHLERAGRGGTAGFACAAALALLTTLLTLPAACAAPAARDLARAPSRTTLDAEAHAVVAAALAGERPGCLRIRAAMLHLLANANAPDPGANR